MLDYKYSFPQYEKWIAAVENYCRTIYPHVQIDMNATDTILSYEFKRGKIKINKETKPRTKLYTFLHEAGHLIRLAERNQRGCFFLDRSGEANSRQRVWTVVEEVLAWQEAEELAHKLRIPIETDAWKRIMTRSIEEYVFWTNGK